MRQRGRTADQIDEAVNGGKRYPAVNGVNREARQQGMFTRVPADQSLSTIKRKRSYMSAAQDLGTETVVYVRLLDEGTDVWRPAPAIPQADGTVKIGKPDDYDGETETWEFPPHTRVKCVRKKFADHGEALVAISAAEGTTARPARARP